MFVDDMDLDTALAFYDDLVTASRAATNHAPPQPGAAEQAAWDRADLRTRIESLGGTPS